MMATKKRWPGGALARTDRVGMEMLSAIRPDFHPTQRRMQAERLRGLHGLSRERASLIAELHFEDVRE